MPAKPQDAKRIARPERQHVVDRYTREKRPRAERQGRFESTLQPPPAHDARRLAGGQEDQGEQDRRDR